jgi:hypothetical protein
MPVLTLIRRVRRRVFRNELLAEGANASSAALAAVILLLLLGTQILSWQWLVAIPFAAAIVGVYLARRRVPDSYVIAQIVDRRLKLSDTLSTALFFSEPAHGAQVSEEVRALQFAEAERLSADIDPRAAIPYTLPRAVYVMGVLFLVASSLFALRYGINRKLDLKQPLANMLQQTFGFKPRTEQAKNTRRALPPDPQAQDDPEGAPQNEEQAGGRDSESQNDAEQSSNRPQQKSAEKSADKGSRQGQEGDQADANEKDGSASDRAGENADNSNSGERGDNKADPKQDAGSKQDGNNSSDNSSLLSKMKDAMQNLLSRMKPQQNQSTGQQQSSMEQNSKQGKGQQAGGKQQAKDGQQQTGGQQGDAQEGQSSEQAQNSQDPQGKGTGKNENQQASKQPGSGIGSQDGDKNVRQAEQLAAMGKISEIIGHRSATVTGEATVEVQSTSQQIRTPYAQRGVQHTQNGSQISRDEVPVALQTYVEQYFEQVRKQQAPPPKK